MTTPRSSKKKLKKGPKPAAEKTPAKPRGRTAVFIPKKAPPPTIDTPPPAEATKGTPTVERDADGREPVPGPTMVAALKYVHAVVPKEDGLVFYTHGADGQPLVSGHDKDASFTRLLPRKAVWELDVAVPRKDSVRFAKLLEGLPPTAMVRVYADGRAVIRHDPAQPEVVVNLGTRPIVDRWQPPSKGDRAQSQVPLRMDAARGRKARSVPEAVARSWQSADGIEWVDVCDTHTGDTLARAVIAEDGRDLYHDDSRQKEIPGSRTAGQAPVTNTEKMAAAPPLGQAIHEQLAAKLHADGVTITVEGATAALPAPAPEVTAG